MTVFSSQTFLIYARPTREKVVIEFLRNRANSGTAVPGFVFSLAKATPDKADAVAKSLPPAVPITLFSPDVDLLPHAKAPARPVYQFTLTQNVPAMDASAAKAAGWLQAIARAQVELGASGVITPSLLLDVNHGETELRHMLAWAARTRQTPEAKNEQFLTGLALHRDWVTKADRRELLLNVLTDSDDEGFYFVVRWAAPARGDQQIADQQGLEGLAEVIEVLGEDEREVVIARAGLAGWALMSLGARAFSASPYPAHVFRDPVTFARKKGSPTIPRIPQYLDRRLLSYVPFSRMSAVNQISGIANCSCPDCIALATGYADRPAFGHYMRTLADLSERGKNAANPRTSALRQVKAARELLASNPGLGLAARTTTHLPIWEALLS